mmetsp:Transcript_67637/g.140195  ORF Transcript_67637/g.140195 Transcript_67637/m.140195 type:complete len:343 (-) Transcript_67637:3-1031(-)
MLCCSMSLESVSGALLVAKRKTSLPFMVTLRYLPFPPSLPAPRATPSASAFKPRWQAPLPSLPMRKPIKASFSASVAVITIAPAPSPKRTHVFRSDQSTQRDKQSAPITTADLKEPERTYCAAVVNAKTKPEQAAVKSKATALSAPSMDATWGPVPKRSSGVEVAWITRSTSSGDIFAAFRALLAAFADSDASDSSGAITCLLLMPVRCEIHSSLVSTISARSSLETTVSGAAEPVPTTEMPKGSARSLRRWRPTATAPQRPERPSHGAPLLAPPFPLPRALARGAATACTFRMALPSLTATRASRLVSLGTSTMGGCLPAWPPGPEPPRFLSALEQFEPSA